MASDSDNIISLMDAQAERTWRSRISTSADEDPDRAARAVDLAQDTGAPADGIYARQDEFERQHKIGLSNQIVDADKYMKAYIQSHPLAATVSNDDWGNLAQAGKSFRDVANLTNRPWWQIGAAGIARGIQMGGAQLAAGVGRMVGSEDLVGLVQRAQRNIDEEIPVSKEDQERIPTMVGEGLGQILSIIPAAVAGGIPGAAISMGLQSGEQEAEKAELAGAPWQTPFVGGFGIGAAMGALPLGFLDKVTGKAAPGVIGWTTQRIKEALVSGAAFAGAGEMGKVASTILEHETYDPSAKYSLDVKQMISNFVGGAILGPSFGMVKTFVDAGEPVPFGTHPVTDKILIEKTKVDNEALDTAIKDAAATSTKERQPSFLATYLKYHPHSSMGLDATKVLEMYGDKLPSPDDGKLGWVPNISAQLEAARRDGSDIQIPLADYVARIDPALDKEFHDFRRVDSNGLTLDEIKQQVDPDETRMGAIARSGTPQIDAYRAQTGMDKILPMPVEQVWDFTPGKGILPPGIDIRDGVGEGKSAKGVSYQVLKELPARDILAQADISLLDKVPKVLYQFFGHQLDKLVGDVPVHIVTRAEINHIYRDIFNMRPGSDAFHWTGSGPDEQRIVMTDDMASGSLGHGYAAHAIIHEMAHALTVKAMREHPELSNLLLRLKGETLDWLRQNDRDALDNPGIRYAFSDKQGFEYIAQAMSDPDFQHRIADIPISPELARDLGKPDAKTLWEAARALIKKALEFMMGKKLPVTVMDGLFSLGERFHALRDSRNPEMGEFDWKDKPGEKPEEPLPTPEERQLFQDYKTLGYTRAHWERVREKVLRQKAEDAEFHKNQVLKDATRRQTETWKANAAEIRPDAEQAVYQQPEIAADRFLRTGNLHGDKVTRQRLDQSKLTPVQKDLLSEEYYGPKGLDPDQVAGLFGYRSGASMISDLAALEAERRKEGLTHNAHIVKKIDVEVERRMRSRYGSLEQQIAEDAKDHVINDGQFDLLHEDTLRLATKFGFDAPWTKADIKALAEADFDEMRNGDVKATKIADATGRIGRKIEAAESAGDAKEVMKLAQQREISFYKTLAARDFERAEGKFEKVAKKHRKIEVASFKDADAAAYHDFIQILLKEVEMPANRRLEDLQAEVAKKGYKDLRDFVESKMREDGEIIPAADFILDGEHKKPIEDLTVGEAKAFMSLVTSLDKYGRERFKFNKENQLIDLKPVFNTMMDEVERFPLVERPATGGPMTKFMHTLLTYDAAMRNAERLFNRFGKDNPRGAWNQFLVRPATEAANYKEVLSRKYGRMFRELGEPPDMEKVFDSPIVKPSTGRQLTRFTNMNKLVMMLNMGSRENWEKFTAGWQSDPEMLKQWVMQHSTEAEWKWVDGVWKIFSKLKEELDGVYRRTTGTPPGTKHFTPIDTPFGTFDGGYYPLVQDGLEIGKGSRTGAEKVLDGKTFLQDSIPNPHAKPVTKAQYPVSLNMDYLPEKFQQMIHDIAFREPLYEMQKVLKYKPLRQTIINHYGKEYNDSINSWLTHISHSAEFNSAASQEGSRVSDFFRQNVISYYVGYNIGTVLKHGPTAFIQSARQVGVERLLKSYFSLYKTESASGDRLWTWAINTSEELQRRERFWQETFGGTYKDFTKSTIRDHVIQWGAKPVAFSDKLSAVPLWIAAFQKASESGVDFGQARFEADRAVRFAHGSTALTNLPEIARGRGIHSWFTSLYGFFGTVMQNRMELGFKLNDMYKFGREGELKEAAKLLPLIAADAFAYVIAPTAIEEYVTGLWHDDRRGWGQRIAWATAGGLANSAIYARDLVHMLEYGIDASGGLLSGAIHPFQQVFHDLSKQNWKLFTKQGAGTLIEDLVAVAGLGMGVPKEVGSIAKYGWDTLVADVQHPRTGLMKNWHEFGDIGIGMTRGKQKATVRK